MGNGSMGNGSMGNGSMGNGSMGKWKKEIRGQLSQSPLLPDS
jgi:hypothetical protein